MFLLGYGYCICGKTSFEFSVYKFSNTEWTFSWNSNVVSVLGNKYNAYICIRWSNQKQFRIRFHITETPTGSKLQVHLKHIWMLIYLRFLFFKGVCNEDGIEKENARNGDSVMRSNSSSSILIAL
jgi:hypothetical protein